MAVLLTRAGTAEDDLSPAEVLGRGRLASIGRVIAVICGLGLAPETAAADPMEEAATEATANESTTRLRAGSVIKRDFATSLRWPLRAAAAYSNVLSRSQPETARPNSRNMAVKAKSGLVDCSQVPRWAKSTVPSSVDARRKNTKATTSHANTMMASE